MRRDPALDGLRGVAIGLVLLEHAGLAPGGWVGVSLFFTLSGYLITTLLVTEHISSGTISLRSFYRRRFARLAPALLVALLATWLVWTFARDMQLLATANLIVVLLYLANIARAFYPHQMVPTAWAWSLSLEEQFYLIYPAVLRAALRRFTQPRIARVLVTGALLLTVLRIVTPANTPITYTLMRGDELLLGAALALAPIVPSRGAHRIALVVFATIALMPPGWFDLTIPLAAAASVMLVAGGGHALTWGPLRYLGRISYAAYLWNGVLLMSVVPIWQLNPTAPVRAFALGGTLLLAVASTHLIEEPLRRRLSGRHVMSNRSTENDRAVPNHTPNPTRAGVNAVGVK